MPTVSYANRSLYISLASAIRLIAERLGCDQTTALHDFIQAAQEGTVATWGANSAGKPDPIVPSMSHTGRRKIHPAAWRDGVVDAAHKRLLVSHDFIWIEPEISRKSFDEVWPEPTRKQRNPNLEQAFDERAAKGKVAGTLAEEARFHKKNPAEKRKLATIKNRLRDRYNALKEAPK